MANSTYSRNNHKDGYLVAAQVLSIIAIALCATIVGPVSIPSAIGYVAFIWLNIVWVCSARKWCHWPKAGCWR